MIYDGSLRDFPRRPGETDDAPRFRRAIDACPNGVLAVPRGEYLIASPLFIRNRCSLDLHPAAVLRAKESVMTTVTNVRENAGDILADAKKINEDRAAAETDAEIADEAANGEDAAE